MFFLIAQSLALGSPLDPGAVEQPVQSIIPPPGNVEDLNQQHQETPQMRQDRIEKTFGEEARYPWVRILNHYEKVNLDFWKRPFLLNHENRVYGEKSPLLFWHFNMGWLVFLLEKDQSQVLGHHSSFSVLSPFESEGRRNWKKMDLLIFNYEITTGSRWGLQKDEAMIYPRTTQNSFFLGWGRLLNYPLHRSFIQDHRLFFEVLISPLRWQHNWLPKEYFFTNDFVFETLVATSYGLSFHRLLFLGFRVGFTLNRILETKFFFNFQVGTDFLESWKEKKKWSAPSTI
jgi:hypothetical protein